MEFAEFKSMILSKLKETSPCTEGYVEFKNAQTYFDLSIIVRSAFEWCVEQGLITTEIIHNHCTDCNKANIFSNQNVKNGFCLVDDNNEIMAEGHSFVIALGSSVVSAFDTCYVIAFDNAKIVAHDDTIVKARGNSKVDAFDFTTVHAQENSSVNGFAHSYTIVGPNAKYKNFEDALHINKNEEN
jgi:hypothetical protein